MSKNEPSAAEVEPSIQDQIRNHFYSSGNGTIARLHFSHCQYYNMPFIEECLLEMDKVVMRKLALDEDPTPLERLAIQLLKESAYLE